MSASLAQLEVEFSAHADCALREVALSAGLEPAQARELVRLAAQAACTEPEATRRLPTPIGRFESVMTVLHKEREGLVILWLPDQQESGIACRLRRCNTTRLNGSSLSLWLVEDVATTL